jgi:hypothetical protein
VCQTFSVFLPTLQCIATLRCVAYLIFIIPIITTSKNWARQSHNTDFISAQFHISTVGWVFLFWAFLCFISSLIYCRVFYIFFVLFEKSRIFLPKNLWTCITIKLSYLVWFFFVLFSYKKKLLLFLWLFVFFVVRLANCFVWWLDCIRK